MATGNVPITAGSGTPIRIVTNSGVDSGANQQVFSLAGPDGTLSPFDPDGTLQVSPEPAGLFLDDFSGTITTTHTTGGTAPSNANGAVTFSTATTAGTTSYCRTIGTFMLRSGSYLLGAYGVKLETAVVTNHSKWWGFGLYGTPNSTTPIVNGAIFQTDGVTGNLFAATFSASARTNYIDISARRPTDGAMHRYEIRYRQSIIYWVIDGVTVASTTQPNLAVANNLASVMGSAVNASSAAGATPSWYISNEGISDLSATHRTIGDGIDPWKQATVKAASTAIAATDLPLAVGLHPSSPLPGGANNIGTVTLNTTASAYTAVTTAAALSAAIKTSAGSMLELTVSNTTTTACFVKLYNKASAPTIGTDVPVATYRVAATGSAGDTLSVPFGPIGKRFPTGIAIGVTGAVGATDTTATVAGIQINATFL